MMARRSPHRKQRIFFAFVFVALASLFSPMHAEILSTVTATAANSSGGTVTATANESVTVVSETPALTVTKSATVNDGGDGIADPGDTVSYVVTVRNTGNVTLFDASANDPLITLSAPSLSDDVAPVGDSTDAAGGAWDTLAPGDAISFTGTYTVVPADVLAGQVSNTASAAATTLTGTPVTGSTTLVTPLPGNSSITLDKTSSLDTGPDGIANAGDTITYQFVVTNTGTTALSNIVVDDPLLMASAADETGMGRVLALMEDATLRADPIATASLAPQGERRNPNLWAMEEEGKAAVARATVLPPELPTAIHGKRRLVNLTSPSTHVGLGDLVGIYIELTNTGDVPITGITVEQQGAEAFGNALDILLPNETNAASIIFTHEITEIDLGAAALDLPAIIRGKSRGRDVTVALTEPMSLGDISTRQELLTADINPPIVPSLNPGQQAIFSGTYTVTQADVDSGGVNNTATATGTPPSGPNVTATDSEVTPLPPAPAIALVKTSSLDLGGDGIATPGDIITYTFTVTNTGNVTLLNIGVTDPLVTVSGGPLASLAPGASDATTFTAAYALTQPDIDAGNVTNQATATGSPPGGGAPVTDLSDDGDVLGDDPTVTNIAASPALTLLKQVDTVTDVNSNSMTDAGDQITYSFTVANTGNVPLSNVAVIDQNPSVVVSPAPPTGITLAPGATDSTSFTAVYTLVQADIDAGFFENTADVTGDAPDGSQATDQSHPTNPGGDGLTRYDITKVPRLTLLKTVASITDTNGNTVTDLTDVINYAFTVANTGNVTLLNVTLTDPNATVAGGPIASLAPGAINSTTFTASHTVSALDMIAGSVSNQATVIGAAATGEQASDLSHPTDPNADQPTVVPVVLQPAIALVKSMQSVTVNDQGTPGNPADDTLEIAYDFAVTNTGNVTLSNIQVTDPLVTVSGSLTSLAPGASDTTSFSAIYTATPADIAAGQVVNQATVNGTAPNNAVATDLSDHTDNLNDRPTIVPLANQPGVAIVMQFAGYSAGDGDGIPEVGEAVLYSFTVSNTGNVPLYNIVVTDLNATVIGGPLVSLPVGTSDSITFSASRTLTPVDLVALTVTNQATVNASSFAGPVSDLSDESSTTGDDPTVVNVTEVPAIAVIKTVGSVTDANSNGFTDEGDTINYVFTITNTGNVALLNITLTDANAAVSGGPLASLAAGTSDSTTFTASHLVTAADFSAAQVTNQATVQGASGSGTIVSDLSDDSSITGNDPTVTPVLAAPVALSMAAARSEIRRGDMVAYTITASSLGSGPFDIADRIPPGFSYVAGTATINGAVATPAISGQTLSFAGIAPVAGTINTTLTLRASTSLSTGNVINRARLYLNATGALLASASATVAIKEDHVFDCGDIIGRVFDDLNGNGTADDGETALAGVRIATVKGILVTTDKTGRFHLSCADIPNAEIGSTFLMKLDTRSLPEGYRVTTENPRDVRLTRGKVTKLNFGVHKARGLALTLNRDAFEKNSIKLKSKWAGGIDRLVALMQQAQSSLTLSYRCTSFAPIAEQRLAHVEELIQARWAESGGEMPLKITTRVECGQE
jgi:uncharacterized repeat protein (TIGR01451 family)